MARLPNHLGKRPAESVGMTLSRVEYPDLYSLVVESGLVDRDEQRAWVRRQVVLLERHGLVRRFDHPDRGHDVQVLSDRGTGDPFDDPTGAVKDHDAYITINGTLFASGVMARWSAPELAFYLAAMIGETHDRNTPDISHRGDGEWWRSDEWFADRDGSRRSVDDVRVPFSKRTLIRGRHRLAADGFVQVDQLSRNPETGRAFAKGGRRNAYLNRFETHARAILQEASIELPEVSEVEIRDAT